MKKRIIKFLTFLLLFSTALESYAAILRQEKAKSHLRWNIYVPQDHIVLNKKESTVSIRSLNLDLFNKLAFEFEKVDPDRRYIKSIKVDKGQLENSIGSIDIELNDANVEFFSFYKGRDRKYIIDFWQEKDDLEKTVSNIENSKKAVSDKKNATLPRGKVVKSNTSQNLSVLAPKKVNRSSSPKRNVKKDQEYRDFRYGASFFWDYQPIFPTLEGLTNLERKTPEFYFPIKNREFDKNEKEAHLQLNINLYRKKKWGLMYKSIKLFREKYGENESVDFNEYLKANALLRENLDKGNTEPIKSAITMFQNIMEVTGNYDMRKGIAKYLISYYISKKDFINSLKLGKHLYVDSKENFDYEESDFAAEVILQSLTRLNQIDKVKELVSDKTIVKLIPKQKLMAYEIYGHLIRGDENEVIKLYEKNKKSLTRPVHPVILFNAGESYFREARYEEAIKIFDQFLADYSHQKGSSQARLRIALAYDILDKNKDEVLELYKNAINRSQDKDIGYEARIRYVGLRSIRKNVIDDNDREVRVFLEQDASDKKNVGHDLKKLLWLVRLRTLIVDKMYREALSYLNAIPANKLPPAERKVFEGDGAEIVYGMIEDYSTHGEHAKLVKLWEIYKNKYVKKVASDPFLNFIVARSYIKLGLFNSLDKIYESFKTLEENPERTFPIWPNRRKSQSIQHMTLELEVIKALKIGNWDLALRKNKELASLSPQYIKTDFYAGQAHFNQKDYKNAIKEIENFLSRKTQESFIDATEIAEIMMAYSESLYELGSLDKFKQVVKAILKDTENYGVNNLVIQNIKERMSYLYIEVLAGENNDVSSLVLEKEILDFKKKHEKSTYLGRVNYLLGRTLMTNKKTKEAIDVYNGILSDDKVSNYIKELVKSELSLIKIKDKTL